jgi:hypothetical protein
MRIVIIEQLKMLWFDRETVQNKNEDREEV